MALIPAYAPVPYRETDVKFVWPVSNENEASVHVIGAWDGWKTSHQLKKKKQKIPQFVAHIGLSPGVYEYKFIVDGVWCTNFADPINEASSYKNNVVKVGRSVRTSLQVSPTQRGRPFLFAFDTEWPMKVVLETAKSICEVEGDYELCLFERTLTRIRSPRDLNDSDRLYLVPTESTKDEDSSHALQDKPLSAPLKSPRFILYAVNDPSQVPRDFNTEEEMSKYIEEQDPNKKLEWHYRRLEISTTANVRVFHS